jgi:hypothetical protein
MRPFRELLANKTKQFFWDSILGSKNKILQLTSDGVKSFEISRTTCLLTDWSKMGLGYTLMQKYCNCQDMTPICGNGHWKLIFAGSRFTKTSESHYAPIEGEALAVAYGLKQCRMFVLGCPDLIVAVDHKPLIKILNDRSLESIENPRLRSLKEKTLMYRFNIIHIKGTTNYAADANSRYPTKSTNIDTSPTKICHDNIEASTVAFAIQQANPITNISWNTITEASTLDNEVQLLRQVIENGFPEDRENLPEILRIYWSMRDELYLIDGIPMKGKKILIPKSLRTRVAEGLHAAHQGITSMKANARERFFWP